MNAEIKNRVSFGIVYINKKEKYIGVNLTEYVRNLYTENYIMWMKETKADPHKRRDRP